MRNAGAARRRREPEPEPPDPIAEAVAELGRLSAETGKLVGRMNRRDGEIAATIAAMPAECEKIADRQALQLIETISLAAHWAEAREVLERVEPKLGTIAMMREAWIAEGRRREAAERDAQPRPRAAGSHRKRHLKPVPGMTSTAVRAAVAAGVAAATVTGSLAAMHEESSVRVVASAPAAARGAHAMAPDSAVLVPASRAPYVARHAKRPSADAASASPAPSPSSSLPVSASPSPPAPVPQPSAEASGVLDVQTALCVIGPDGTGTITFSAVGGPLWWQASSSSPDVILGDSGARLASGGPEVLTLEVAPGTVAGAATVTITAGGQSVQVPVTWVAVPGLPL